MAQESISRNPFMLMMHPELVLAAVEKSERLSQLNRHLCRPLDRPSPQTNGSRAESANASDEPADDEPGG
jgi:hypothetical protein